MKRNRILGRNNVNHSCFTIRRGCRTIRPWVNVWCITTSGWSSPACTKREFHLRCTIQLPFNEHNGLLKEGNYWCAFGDFWCVCLFERCSKLDAWKVFNLIFCLLLYAQTTDSTVIVIMNASLIQGGCHPNWSCSWLVRSNWVLRPFRHHTFS